MCEFCQKLDFENVNFSIDSGFLPQCAVSPVLRAGVFSKQIVFVMLSWQLYTQLFREMENENAAEYVCIDYDNKVISDDNDFEPETHCKNFKFSCFW